MLGLLKGSERNRQGSVGNRKKKKKHGGEKKRVEKNPHQNQRADIV